MLLDFLKSQHGTPQIRDKLVYFLVDFYNFHLYILIRIKQKKEARNGFTNGSNGQQCF